MASRNGSIFDTLPMLKSNSIILTETIRHEVLQIVNGLSNISLDINNMRMPFVTRIPPMRYSSLFVLVIYYWLISKFQLHHSNQ